MYDIKGLEKEWQRYKSRQRRPYYIGLAFIVLGTLGGFILQQNTSFFIQNETKIKTIQKTKINETNQIAKRLNFLINPGLTTLQVKEENNIPVAKEERVKDMEVLVDIPVLEIEPEEEIQDAPVKKTISIIETSSISAYKEVEKRFIKSHDINDALFLAQSYYKKKMYQKALSWAYEVNKLDHDIEDGILIYVKAKYHLGKKNEALSILDKYFKRSHSKEAQKILYKIKKHIDF